MANKEKTKRDRENEASTVTETLAEKYRPKFISDLCGQEQIAAQLRGMVKAKRFHSTIGLFGESGAGKTTTAQMIARYVNCLSPTPEGDPCGECASCKYGDAHPDYTEINFAADRGIDDARSLIASARSMPSLGRKRVFVLDELHGATPVALQALLKPLEKTSPHVIWILATTNPEKLPTTILGRCLKLYVKPLPKKAIIDRLAFIAKAEKSPVAKMEDAKKIYSTIADLSNGRMRDSIQSLESVMFAVLSGKDLTVDTLIAKYARSADADLDESAALFLVSLVAGEAKEAIRTVLACGNVRGLLSKTRWLVQSLIQDVVGQKFFRTYTIRCYENLVKSRPDFKLRLRYLLEVQDLLCTIEMQLNSVSIDETVLFTSRVGRFIVERSKA